MRTLKQTCSQDYLWAPLAFKNSMTHMFCNSHYVSHFAAFFIDVGAKISSVTSFILGCFHNLSFCYFVVRVFKNWVSKETKIKPHERSISIIINWGKKKKEVSNFQILSNTQFNQNLTKTTLHMPKTKHDKPNEKRKKQKYASTPSILIFKSFFFPSPSSPSLFFKKEKNDKDTDPDVFGAK